MRTRVCSHYPMTTRSFAFALTLAFGIATPLVLGPTAEAREKKLKQADVPKPVMAALAAKYPAAKWRSFGTEQEQGATVYEVEFRQGPSRVSVDISPEGTILVEETTLSLAEVPVAVRDGIAGSKYKGWNVVKAEKVIEKQRADAPTYEVLVENKGQKFELVIDKDGKIATATPKGQKDTD
jgi:uncharacterized membrane protein YkoI